MNALFILAIIFGGLAVAGLIVGATCGYRWQFPAVMTAIASMFIGFIMFGCGAGLEEDKYDTETVRICTDLGGVTTVDGHCFKDNKPIEFSPGVWKR